MKPWCLLLLVLGWVGAVQSAPIRIDWAVYHKAEGCNPLKWREYPATATVRTMVAAHGAEFFRLTVTSALIDRAAELGDIPGTVHPDDNCLESCTSRSCRQRFPCLRLCNLPCLADKLYLSLHCQGGSGAVANYPVTSGQVVTIDCSTGNPEITEEPLSILRPNRWFPKHWRLSPWGEAGVTGGLLLAGVETLRWLVTGHG